MIALKKVSSICGTKSAMVAHLAGSRPCPHASEAARQYARKEKEAMKITPDTSDSSTSRKRKAPPVIIQKVAKKMKQSELKVFRGIDIPFSEAEIIAIRNQFVRATISANLPFRWVENPEIVKIFLMLRSQADHIIPGRRVIAGSLLRNESDRVEDVLKKLLLGRYTTLL